MQLTVLEERQFRGMSTRSAPGFSDEPQDVSDDLCHLEHAFARGWFRARHRERQLYVASRRHSNVLNAQIPAIRRTGQLDPKHAFPS
jgi:hypothetical protein